MDAGQARQVRTGMLLIALGLLFLGSELSFWGSLYISRLWPIVLIALGAGFVLFPGESGRSGGAWLLFVGVVFLLHGYRVVSVRDSWPLFIVAAGVAVLAGGLKRAPRKEG
jgi:hypothetical protein